ncbi:MAG: tRNA (adenine(22)-N(1))-methyltransferase TrmK [Lactobacillaceae bacterium]|jgi:tRNA (adenine22-N1)-methyltransferase|nr:tRNA (adenine(22)-N(1))-methyltransferase TrmK [Lactobacillaceae bacterium]
MDATQLSPRLALVASFVLPGARLADIGSDHAYLPAHLLLKHQIEFAVAGEITAGPLANVEQEIQRTQLQGKLVGRLGDGFAAVQPTDQIDTVTIAGMGGRLIADILTAGHSTNQQYQRLILQPNIDVDVVRTWLQANHYALIDEAMVFDDQHYYEVLVAQPGETAFDAPQLKYGPFNIKQQPPVWRERWQREADRLANLMTQLSTKAKTDTPAYARYQAQHQQITEVLDNAGK